MKKVFKNKKLMLGMLFVLVLIISAITSIVLLNGKGNEKDSDTFINNSVENGTKNKETYLVISINPKIMLHLDNDGKVIELFQLNKDAVIFTNDELKDLDLDNAIDKIVTIAQDNGYLKDTKDISVSVLNNSNNDNSDTVAYMNKVAEQLETKGLNVKKEEISSEEQKTIESTIENYVEKRVEDNTTEKPDNKPEPTQSPTTTKNINITEKIPFSSKNEEEANMLRGTTKISQEGQEGTKIITYKVTYNDNGKEISSSKVSERITKQPVTQITKVGISDYNINTDVISSNSNGMVCFENQLIIYEDGFKECDESQVTNYFASITLKNKEYVYYIGNTDNRDLVNMKTLLHVSNGKINYDSNVYVLDGRSGSNTPIPLTFALCAKYGLSCGSW